MPPSSASPHLAPCTSGCVTDTSLAAPGEGQRREPPLQLPLFLPEGSSSCLTLATAQETDPGTCDFCQDWNHHRMYVPPRLRKKEHSEESCSTFTFADTATGITKATQNLAARTELCQRHWKKHLQSSNAKRKSDAAEWLHLVFLWPLHVLCFMCFTTNCVHKGFKLHHL